MQNRAFLGPVIDLGSLQDETAVYIILREASRQQVIVDPNVHSQAQAAKTRGRSSWVGTSSFGCLGRPGLRSSNTCNTEQLAACRTYSETHRDFIKVTASMPPRKTDVGHAPETPLVIYPNAEYESSSGRQPRVGWVLFRMENQPPLGRPLFWNSASLGRCTDMSTGERRDLV